jgi:hypothetical protein
MTKLRRGKTSAIRPILIKEGLSLSPDINARRFPMMYY